MPSTMSCASQVDSARDGRACSALSAFGGGGKPCTLPVTESIVLADLQIGSSAKTPCLGGAHRTGSQQKAKAKPILQTKKWEKRRLRAKQRTEKPYRPRRAGTYVSCLPLSKSSASVNGLVSVFSLCLGTAAVSLPSSSSTSSCLLACIACLVL